MPVLKLVVLLSLLISLSGCLGGTARVAVIGSQKVVCEVRCNDFTGIAELDFMRLTPSYSSEAPFFADSYAVAEVDHYELKIRHLQKSDAKNRPEIEQVFWMDGVVRYKEPYNAFLIEESDAVSMAMAQRIRDTYGVEIILVPGEHGVGHTLMQYGRTERQWYNYPAMAVSPIMIPLDIVGDIVFGIVGIVTLPFQSPGFVGGIPSYH